MPLDGIPYADQRALADTFVESPGTIPELSPGGFVVHMDQRIYTEWCMDGCKGAQRQVQRYLDYQKVGPFAQWIADETHYALERLMQAGQGKINEEMYQQMRMKVVRAAATRAMELFRTWKQHQRPPDDDPRNLRASLEPYLSTAAS